MKIKVTMLMLLLTTVAFIVTNVVFVSAYNGDKVLQVTGNACSLSLSSESGFSLSTVEIFILVFCFLFALGLVVLWQFCFRKKR